MLLSRNLNSMGLTQLVHAKCFSAYLSIVEKLQKPTKGLDLGKLRH
jgi:hypothetical protein